MKDWLVAFVFVASLIFALISIYFASNARFASLFDSKEIIYKPIGDNHAKYI